MIFDYYAALRNACRPPRLKNICRLPGVRLRDPSTCRPAAEPFVFKQRKLLNIRIALHFLQRIKLQLLLLIQPKRASRRIVKVVLDGLVGMLIELVLSSLNAGFEFSGWNDFG